MVDDVKGLFTSMPELGSLKESGNEFVIDVGSVRTVIYAKEEILLSAESKCRAIKVEELPDKLVDDFGDMTEGLLPSAVLMAIGELRRVTHRLINKFPSKLDASYLNHRSLTVPSDEALSHIYPLIASEIESILSDCNVDDALDESAINDWLEGKISNGLELGKNTKIRGNVNAKEAVYDLIVKGVDSAKKKYASRKSFVKSLEQISEGKPASLSYLTSLLLDSDESGCAQDYDRELAMRMSIRSRYAKPNPVLQLGAVVKKGRKYYLCIQPICDAARVSGYLDFNFLTLSKSNKPCDLVVEYNNAFVELKVLSGKKDVSRFKFKPKTNNNPVLAKNEDGAWYFDGGELKFEWICDLKIPQAQRIANEYAAKISRVGLTESEWIRRQK